MNIYYYPEKEAWRRIYGRAGGSPLASIAGSVAAIIKDVYEYGDEKILEYVEKFDGYASDIQGLAVTEEELSDAGRLVTPALAAAIRTAAANIRKFHESQMPEDIEVETMPGVVCRQKSIAIPNVGLYIPGGTAPLFSTVLMLAIPAMVAGCKRVIMCTPARRDGTVSPAILFAAHLCGVDEIYKIGGAVAIAAMACGTATVPKVDKIFGPGNQYVTEAKKQISSDCAIDMPAGPSEVLIMADDTAVPEFICADFLSQLEHGKDSQAILLTSSETLAKEVCLKMPEQMSGLSRCGFIGESIKKSVVVVLKTEEEMLEFSNMYAPEHLIISTADSRKTAEGVVNAGSVFLGNYSPESAGDYASGTNHTLPTNGWAVSCSGVNLSSFMKKITIQEISQAGLKAIAPTIEAMAEAEGLDAHANAVSVRLGRQNSDL